jgi:hypothetical protein
MQVVGSSRHACGRGRDVFHRARTIERHQRDDVFEAVRLHADQRLAHALTFDLEHADRLAARSIRRSSHRRAAGARSIFDRRARMSLTARRRDGQRLEAKEVELHQARGSTHFMLNWVTGMSERGSR